MTTVETVVSRPDPEVRAPNRSYAPKYKLQVLAEVDAAETRGQVGEIMRREGLYSSLISEWRKQRERGALEAMSGRRPGRKSDPVTAENARLRQRGHHAGGRVGDGVRVDRGAGKSLGAVAADLPPQRRTEVSVMLEANVETFAAKVGTARACRAFGVNVRTHRHRRQAAAGRARPRPPRPSTPRRPHPASLSDREKDCIVATLCSPRFSDLAPAQVYTTLLDEGSYLCSERQMYRVLAERGLVRERRRGGHARHGFYGVPRLEADGANQCWTWDITKLAGPTRGVRYFLYTIIDIFSRKVVGWTIAERQSETVARRLITETCRNHGVDRDNLTIHADRGGPMIAGTVAELLNDLGITKSHSRPRVSNDNPFIEAHFKTLKYRPDYPDRFTSISDARAWCRRFFHWYNEVHYHSGIG